jgi:argininosuccinate lyase
LTPAVRDVLTVHGSLSSRRTPNGTAPSSVRHQLAAALGGIEAAAEWASHLPHKV